MKQAAASGDAAAFSWLLPDAAKQEYRKKQSDKTGWMLIMLKLILATMVVLLPTTAFSAEFPYKGKVVKSTVEDKITICGDTKIDVRIDAFPREYEAQESDLKIPKGLTIKHNETDRFVSNDVYVTTSSQKTIKLPDVKTLIKNEPTLLKYFSRYKLGGAEYIPTLAAKCTDTGFSVSYWVGGNGRTADSNLLYTLEKGSLSLEPLVKDEVFHKLLKDSI